MGSWKSDVVQRIFVLQCGGHVVCVSELTRGGSASLSGAGRLCVPVGRAESLGGVACALSPLSFPYLGVYAVSFCLCCFIPSVVDNAVWRFLPSRSARGASC